MQKTNNKIDTKFHPISGNNDSDIVKHDQRQNVVKQSIVKEINGPKGLEPTRYGDWESKGRCHDF